MAQISLVVLQRDQRVQPNQVRSKLGMLGHSSVDFDFLLQNTRRTRMFLAFHADNLDGPNQIVPHGVAHHDRSKTTRAKYIASSAVPPPTKHNVGIPISSLLLPSLFVMDFRRGRGFLMGWRNV